MVSDKIVWVSGTGGTVGRSTDGGDSWTWMTVKGFEKMDFRDIEAFDEKTAIIMGIADPAYPEDHRWRTELERGIQDTTKGMFSTRWILPTTNAAW